MRQPPQGTYDAEGAIARGPAGSFPSGCSRPLRACGRQSLRKIALPPTPSRARPLCRGRPEPSSRRGSAPRLPSRPALRCASLPAVRPYLSRRGSGGGVRRELLRGSVSRAAAGTALPGKGAARRQGCTWAAPACAGSAPPRAAPAPRAGPPWGRGRGRERPSGLRAESVGWLGLAAGAVAAVLGLRLQKLGYLRSSPAPLRGPLVSWELPSPLTRTFPSSSRVRPDLLPRSKTFT